MQTFNLGISIRYVIARPMFSFQLHPQAPHIFLVVHKILSTATWQLRSFFTANSIDLKVTLVKIPCFIYHSDKVWTTNYQLMILTSNFKFEKCRNDFNRVMHQHGSLMDWKMGKLFYSQGILNRLEKSGNFTQNIGNMRKFLPVFTFF